MSTSESSLQLGAHSDIFQTENPFLSAENIREVDPGLWVHSQSEVLNFSFSEQIYWSRVFVTNPSSETAVRIVELASPVQDYLDLFLFDGNSLIDNLMTGDRRSFSQREYVYRNPTMRMEIQPEQTIELLIRYQSHDGLFEAVPITLWTEDAFNEATRNEWLILGLYYGCILALLVYNLLLFVSSRDRVFLYYAIYLSLFAIWNFSFLGFSFQYFWPDYPGFNNQVLIASLIGIGWSLSAFSMTYLSSRTKTPTLHRLLKFMMLMLLVPLIMALFGVYASAFKIMIPIAQGIVLLLVSMAVIQSSRGDRLARIYLLAWIVLFAGMIIYYLKLYGVLPSNWFTEYVLNIGSAMEILLLAFALAERINRFKARAQKALEERNAVLANSNQLKDQFLALASHELRTPLNGLMGYLEQVNIDEPMRSDIDLSTRQLHRLVDRILEYTDLHRNTYQLHPTAVKLNSWAVNISEPWKERLKEKGLQFDLALHFENDLVIQMDPRIVHKMVVELLDNAVTVTERGSVGLSISWSKGYLTIVVADQGGGIPDDVKERIQEPFEQVDTSPSRQPGGLGLGLSLTRAWVELMNGEFILASDGSSSTAKLVIPAQLSYLTVSDLEMREIEPGGTLDQISVMIVEDNPINQRLFQLFLDRLGVNYQTVSDGQSALDLLTQGFQPSLILMDCHMPVMNGYETTQRIREQFKYLNDVPIVAVTANAMSSDRDYCYEIGMNDYLSKPVQLSDIREMLQRNLGVTTTLAKVP